LIIYGNALDYTRHALDYTGHEHHGKWLVAVHSTWAAIPMELMPTIATPVERLLLASANIDGNDTFDLPDKFLYIPASDDKNDFDETKSFSFVFWMMDHCYANYGLYKTIVGKKAIDGPIALFEVTTTSEPCGMDLVNYVSVAVQDEKVRYSDAGEWVHVAMVSSGSELSLNLNNTLVNSTVFNPKQPSHHGFLASGNSGKSFGPADQPWTSGLLSHVTYWNEAITKNDVNHLFLQGICPVSTKGFFWLVDTNKNQEIRALDDGYTIELHVPRDALSIQAFFVPAGSVRLELLWDVDGSLVHHQIENY
jgi:hypothetical protein